MKAVASEFIISVAQPALAIAAAVTVVVLALSPSTRLQVSNRLSGATNRAAPVTTAERYLLSAYKSSADENSDNVVFWTDKLLQKDPSNTDALLQGNKAHQSE